MLIENKFKKDDVVSIKLSSGEELIGRYVKEDMQVLELSKVMSIVMTQQGVGLGPFMFSFDVDQKGFPKENIKFSKTTVMAIGKTAEGFAAQFNSSVSGVEVAQKPSIIT
jgi:hypothetical protein